MGGAKIWEGMHVRELGGGGGGWRGGGVGGCGMWG